jgi:hypothetical protein
MIYVADKADAESGAKRLPAGAKPGAKPKPAFRDIRRPTVAGQPQQRRGR